MCLVYEQMGPVAQLQGERRPHWGPLLYELAKRVIVRSHPSGLAWGTVWATGRKPIKAVEMKKAEQKGHGRAVPQTNRPPWTKKVMMGPSSRTRVRARMKMRMSRKARPLLRQAGEWKREPTPCLVRTAVLGPTLSPPAALEGRGWCRDQTGCGRRTWTVRGPRALEAVWEGAKHTGQSGGAAARTDSHPGQCRPCFLGAAAARLEACCWRPGRRTLGGSGPGGPPGQSASPA